MVRLAIIPGTAQPIVITKGITDLPERLTFGSITEQGLPFYGGVVSYHIPLEIEADTDVNVGVPHYRSAVISAELSGEKRATIAYPPYEAAIGKLAKGKHTVTLNAYISRHNCFGHIHCADSKFSWLGPDCWRTNGSLWTYEYRLLPEGILSAPEFLI